MRLRRPAARYAKASLAAGSGNSPANGTQTAVTLDTLETDGDGFTLASNKLVVSRAGLYIVQACICWQIGGGTGYRSTQVRKNGANPAICGTDGSATSAGTFTIQSCGVLTRLAAGDFLELMGQQGSGAGLAVLGGSNGPTFLSVTEMLG